MMENVQNHIGAATGFGHLLQNTAKGIDECHVMQFTGLADKNGVEIYEGDIVTDGENFGEVKFFTDGIASCGCCITSFSGSGFAAYTQDECDGFYLEKCLVAGNIHQHPELLK